MELKNTSKTKKGWRDGGMEGEGVKGGEGGLPIWSGG